MEHQGVINENNEFFEINIRQTKTKSKKKKTNQQIQQQNPLLIKEIFPKTENQSKVFDFYLNKKNILLSGTAGCGKTFLSMYLSLNEIINDNSNYKKLNIVRSVVSTRSMGFLPGSIKEKSKIYEAPYYPICSELFGRGDSYEILKQKGYIDFITSSFLRGTTFRNCIILIDEFQNMTLHEFSSIITRIGDNCKLLICGDINQTDHVKQDEKNEVKSILKILDKMNSIEKVQFKIEDIQRSKLVKDFLITKDLLGL